MTRRRPHLLLIVSSVALLSGLSLVLMALREDDASSQTLWARPRSTADYVIPHAARSTTASCPCAPDALMTLSRTASSPSTVRDEQAADTSRALEVEERFSGEGSWRTAPAKHLTKTDGRRQLLGAAELIRSRGESDAELRVWPTAEPTPLRYGDQ